LVDRAACGGGGHPPPHDQGVKDKARAQVRDLMQRFPVYA
jgi:hypothetical protein